MPPSIQSMPQPQQIWPPSNKSHHDIASSISVSNAILSDPVDTILYSKTSTIKQANYSPISSIASQRPASHFRLQNLLSMNKSSSSVNKTLLSCTNANIASVETKKLPSCMENNNHIKKSISDSSLTNSPSIKPNDYAKIANSVKLDSVRRVIVSHLPRSVVEGLKVVINATCPFKICLTELLPKYKVRNTIYFIFCIDLYFILFIHE